MDLIYIVVSILFFAACVGYVQLADTNVSTNGSVHV